jgi:hypothetical protein
MYQGNLEDGGHCWGKMVFWTPEGDEFLKSQRKVLIEMKAAE